MEIFKSFTFDSAHYLPHVPDEHKCKNMHGHTYHLHVYLNGEIDTKLGWVMDFGDLKDVIKKVISRVDHKVLNEIPGLENPTCELFAQWFWDALEPDLAALSKIKLYETPTSGAIVRRKD